MFSINSGAAYLLKLKQTPSSTQKNNFDGSRQVFKRKLLAAAATPSATPDRTKRVTNGALSKSHLV